MGDVCLCEYMSHGHCGIVKQTFTPQSLGAAVRDAPKHRRSALLRVKSKEEKERAIATLASVAARAAQSSFEIDNDASLELLARTQSRWRKPASTSSPPPT